MKKLYLSIFIIKVLVFTSCNSYEWKDEDNFLLYNSCMESMEDVYDVSMLDKEVFCHCLIPKITQNISKRNFERIQNNQSSKSNFNMFIYSLSSNCGSNIIQDRFNANKIKLRDKDQN